ncbi:MAG TPA: VOC family protein [Candidatus Cybelea sp.]|jgi:hypothetical protein|nr:VOC family protein [Candidatus Cybelea sp.]
MSERTHYPAGVPCWVDTLQPNPEAAKQFYGDVFGWEFIAPGQMPGTPPGKYFVAQLRGHDVAGIASQPEGVPASTAWNTHIAVDSVDATCAKILSTGGTVLVAPFDARPAGRMAVVSDPAGAVFCIWEANDRRGAQLVNEPSAWAMNVLTTRDSEGAKRFYGEVFGWRTDTVEAGGTPITLWRLPGYVGGEPQQPVPRDVVAVMVPPNASTKHLPPHWSVDFWIDDVDRAAATAAKLGANLIEPPRDTPGFRTCVLADPQGAIFSLSQLTAFQ